MTIVNENNTRIKLILSTTVGSRAHGTVTEMSDIDTRSVYLIPTSALVGVSPKPYFKSDPGVDDNCWELDRFIELAMKGNPSVLEVLLVEPDKCTEEGEELRKLFPHFLRKIAIWGSFYGFITRQKDYMLSDKSKRRNVAAAHYLRAIYNGTELLRTGTMTVRIVDTPIGQSVLDAKLGRISFEEVAQIGFELMRDFQKAYDESTLPDKANLAEIDKFLVKTRKDNW